MQTRTYGDLFSLITNMIGAVELAADEQTQVKNFINRRFQEAFDTSPIWPRYIVVSEERELLKADTALLVEGIPNDDVSLNASEINGQYTLLGLGNGSGVESSGTNVYSHQSIDCIAYNSGFQWRFDQGATAAEQTDGTYVVTSDVPPEITEIDAIKKDSIFDVTEWADASFEPVPSVVTTRGTGRNVVLYAEVGKNTIGEFERIHRKNAFLNNSAVEYDFFADGDGANILNVVNANDSKAFVTYKKQFTPFTVVSDFYNSTATVPAEFFNYIAHAVYADFLRVQNKQEEAIAEENVAEKYLAQELEKVDIRMNNSTINKRFSTYVNRQSR
jgi:hypothetical protein